MRYNYFQAARSRITCKRGKKGLDPRYLFYPNFPRNLHNSIANAQDHKNTALLYSKISFAKWSQIIYPQQNISRPYFTTENDNIQISNKLHKSLQKKKNTRQAFGCRSEQAPTFLLWKQACNGEKTKKITTFQLQWAQLKVASQKK